MDDTKLGNKIVESGNEDIMLSFQLQMLLTSLKREIEKGYKVCNSGILVGGSLRNSIAHWIKDPELPKHKKKAYEYLVEKGYYDFEKVE